MSNVMRRSAGLACAVMILLGCAGRTAKPAVARGAYPDRANAQRTGAYDTEGPRKMTDTVVLFTQPGKLGFGVGTASPVVEGSLALFGSGDSSLYALDVRTGAER